MEESQKHLMALLQFLLELALSVVFGAVDTSVVVEGGLGRITMRRMASLLLEFQLKPSFFGHRWPFLELVFMDLQI